MTTCLEWRQLLLNAHDEGPLIKLTDGSAADNSDLPLLGRGWHGDD